MLPVLVENVSNLNSIMFSEGTGVTDLDPLVSNRDEPLKISARLFQRQVSKLHLF